MHLKTTLITSLTSIGLGLFMVSTSTMAESQANGLNGAGEIGFTDNAGNTTSTSLFGAVKLNYVQDKYELKSLIEANYKSENEVQTQERYIGEFQGNQFYTPDKSYYGFIQSRFEKDRFEKVDLNAIATIGMGRVLFQNEATDIDGEIGIGYQSTDYTDNAIDNDFTQGITRVKLNLAHKFNTQTTFLQDVVYLSGTEQTKIETNTGVKVKVADDLNLSLSYKYRHNDKPAIGTKENDSQTMITLIYDF